METEFEPLNPELDPFLRGEVTDDEGDILVEIVEVPAEYNNLDAYTEEHPLPTLDNTLNNVFSTDESVLSEYFSLSLVSSPEQESLSTTQEQTDDKPTIEKIDTNVVKSSNNNVTREFSIVLHRISEETIRKLTQRRSNISKRGRKRFVRVNNKDSEKGKGRRYIFDLVNFIKVSGQNHKVENKRSRGRPKKNQDEQTSGRKQGTKRKYERRTVKSTNEESEIKKKKKDINGNLEKDEQFDSSNEPPKKKRRGGPGRPKKNKDGRKRKSTSKSSLPKDDLPALPSPEIRVFENDEQTPEDKKNRTKTRQSYSPEDLYKPRPSTSTTRRNKMLIRST